MQYDKQSYIVSGQRDFTLTEALRLWKAKYPEFIDFKKDVILHPNLEDFGKFVEEHWDDIKPVTVEEALKLSNTETRRTYFDCIGVVQLFKSLNPKLLDRQVITKKELIGMIIIKKVFVYLKMSMSCMKLKEQNSLKKTDGAENQILYML